MLALLAWLLALLLFGVGTGTTSSGTTQVARPSHVVVVSSFTVDVHRVSILIHDSNSGSYSTNSSMLVRVR